MICSKLGGHALQQSATACNHIRGQLTGLLQICVHTCYRHACRACNGCESNKDTLSGICAQCSVFTRLGCYRPELSLPSLPVHCKAIQPFFILLLLTSKLACQCSLRAKLLLRQPSTRVHSTRCARKTLAGMAKICAFRGVNANTSGINAELSQRFRTIITRDDYGTVQVATTFVAASRQKQQHEVLTSQQVHTAGAISDQ
eukprot:20034-Heterococcus_DN1.PRE.3